MKPPTLLGNYDRPTIQLTDRSTDQPTDRQTDRPVHKEVKRDNCHIHMYLSIICILYIKIYIFKYALKHILQNAASILDLNIQPFLILSFDTFFELFFLFELKEEKLLLVLTIFYIKLSMKRLTFDHDLMMKYTCSRMFSFTTTVILDFFGIDKQKYEQFCLFSSQSYASHLFPHSVCPLFRSVRLRVAGPVVLTPSERTAAFS